MSFCVLNLALLPMSLVQKKKQKKHVLLIQHISFEKKKNYEYEFLPCIKSPRARRKETSNNRCVIAAENNPVILN